jgi:EAL domain-containing protein (putative c-di-GMP-specific phosphodiesterase class I)
LNRDYVAGETEIAPRGSIGIAVAAGPDVTADEVMRNADLALYEAKNAGKSRWMLFAPEMHDLAVERLALTSELRHGLDAGEIVVHYQPVVALATGSIVGFEALARWNHPTRGLLLPGRFIGIAEDTGLIHQLGRTVLDIALGDAARWQRRPDRRDLRMAVNVSGRQLQDPGIVDDVRLLLDRHGVDPRTLILEFTESVLLPGDTGTLERIHALSALGVRLYIDDFGTGYSSLSYLQQLPVDGMKLAEDFVRGLPGSANEKGLVRAILDMADTLGLDAVVAEGVERDEQRSSLMAIGYGVAQGFHLGMPQPADAVEELLEAARRAHTGADATTR